MCDLLDDQVRRGGCDALNIRVFQAGIEPEAVREQIELLGEQVLPRLRMLAEQWPRR